MRSQMPITTRMSCSISRIVTSKRVRMSSIRCINCVALLRIEPGRGLIEQQQPRLARERARDLEPALLAVGQLRRARVRPGRRARGLRAARRRCASWPRSSWPRSAPFRSTRRQEPGAGVLVRGDAHVVEARSATANSRMFWNVRVMPRRGDRGAAADPGSGRPSNTIAALGRRVDAGDHVEDRGLAGAVRSDQTQQLARGMHRQVTDRPRP